MIRCLINAVLLFVSLMSAQSLGATGVIVTNGTQFLDTDGNVIHAHGGGILQKGDQFFWYGEHRDSADHFLGISCYESQDLKNWKYRGDVLTKNSATELNSCTVERPKVLFNKLTKKYVMWMHWENGRDYLQARCAVAVSDGPDLVFTYQGSFRPCQDQAVTDHGAPGYMSRDCTLFQDTDGTGYFISAANDNADLHIYELTPDFQHIAKLTSKLFIGQYREAPCLVKKDDCYCLITSGCTGWSPNQAQYACSSSIASNWPALRNLQESLTTYDSQPACVIPLAGRTGTSYLYAGDRWAGAWEKPVSDSQYVWLPLIFDSKTNLSLPYGDTVRIDASQGTVSTTNCYQVISRRSGKLLEIEGSSVDGGAKAILWADNGGLNQRWKIVPAHGFVKLVNMHSGKVLEAITSNSGNPIVIQAQDSASAAQEWTIQVETNGFKKLRNRATNEPLCAASDDQGIENTAPAAGQDDSWLLRQEVPGLSLVPDLVNPAPDYFCTWNLQGFVCSYKSPKDQRAQMTETNLFGKGKYQEWVRLFPRIRGDLILVMDDSWDVPADGDSSYFGSLQLNEERFPSFNGTAEERLKKLVAAVKAAGWKGLGGWGCAHQALQFAVSNEQAYWRQRLTWMRRAGVAYWKVDWGKNDRDATWRRMLTKLGHEYAPDLVIEHALTTEVVDSAAVFRTYDVENVVATPVTIDRVATLIQSKNSTSPTLIDIHGGAGEGQHPDGRML